MRHRVLVFVVLLAFFLPSVSAAWQYERELSIVFPASSVAQDGNTPVYHPIDFGRAITDAQLYKNDKATAVDFNLHTYPGATGCYADGNCLLSFTYFDENTIYIRYNNDTRSNSDTGVDYFGINDGVYAHYKMQELTPLDWAWGRDASSASGTAGSTDCVDGTCLAFGSGDKVTFPFTGAQLGDGTVAWTWELKSEAATQRLIGTGQGGANYAGCYAFDSGGGDYAINCTSDSGAETVQWNIVDTPGLVHKIVYSWGGSGQFLWGATGDSQLLLRDTGTSTATGNYTSNWELCQFGSWAGSECLSESPVDEVVFWDNQITSISDLPGWIEDTNAEQLGLSIGAEVSLGGAGPTITTAISPNPTTLYPDRGINSVLIDFNSSNTPSDGATILDGNWYVEGSWVSSDENFVWGPVSTRYLDINVTRFSRDQNGVSQDDTNLNIYQASFDLNTQWSPSVPGKLENTDFNSSWDTNGASIAAMLEIIGDQNVLMTAGAFDANVVHIFTTSGNKNLRLHVQNQDANEQSAIFQVGVAGSFTACLIDENRSTPIITANVTANGATQTLDASACFTFGLGSYSLTSNTTTTFLADANVGAGSEEFQQRAYVYDLNRLSDYDVNFLLVDENGNYISFVFYDTDETTVLSSTFVQAFYANIDQVAGRRLTGADGSAQFYLNPNDPGTIFQVERSTGVVWYYTTSVTCNVPLDESDLTAITPYDLTVGGLGYQDYNGLTAAQTFPILSNTQQYYTATIDGGTQYYTRQYAFNTQGDTNAYSFTPYLVDINNGTSATIVTQDQLTTESVPDVLVILLKNIPGLGQTVVESTETDITGTAIVSYILGDALGYTIQFYNQAGELLGTGYLRPSTTQYKANILTDSLPASTPSFTTTVPVIVMSPTNGFIQFEASGINGFDVNASGSIDGMRVRVQQGPTIVDTNYFMAPVPASIRFDYNIDALNANQLLTVYVDANVSGRNYSETKAFAVSTQGNNFQLLAIDVVGDTGDLGPGAGPWLVAFSVIAVLSSAGAFLAGAGALGIGFIVLAVLGIGLYLTWIPLPVFIIAIIGTIGVYLATRR